MLHESCRLVTNRSFLLQTLFLRLTNSSMRSVFSVPSPIIAQKTAALSPFSRKFRHVFRSSPLLHGWPANEIRSQTLMSGCIHIFLASIRSTSTATHRSVCSGSIDRA